MLQDRRVRLLCKLTLSFMTLAFAFYSAWERESDTHTHSHKHKGRPRDTERQVEWQKQAGSKPNIMDAHRKTCIEKRLPFTTFFRSARAAFIVYDTEQDRVKFVSHMLGAYHLASWFWSHPSASAQLHPSTVISNPSWVLTTSVAGLWNTSVKFEKKNHKKIQISLQCSICHNF